MYAAPMHVEPLDPTSLVAEQRRLFLAARSGVSAPAAGAIYWLALGVAGFYLPERSWCLLAFVTSGAIFPLAIALQKPLKANMFVKSALDSLTFPTLLPVMLCFGFSIPAFHIEPELVPLGLTIGLTVHWPTIGWMYGRTRAFSSHAIIRVLSAVVLWYAFPDLRFSLIPLSTGFVYAATFLYLMYDVVREEKREIPPLPAP